MNALVTLVGRILLSLIFIVSGISKIGSYATTVAYMESRGVPMAPVFLYLAVLFEIGGGLSVATGYRARTGALMLLAFLLPVTYLFHFKPAFDAAMNLVDRAQMIQVLKNVSIIGALLLLWGNGPGRFTLGKEG